MKQLGDLLACLKKTLHHTDRGTAGIIQMIGDGGEYRVALLTSNIAAAQVQLATARGIAHKEGHIELCESIIGLLRMAESYLGPDFPVDPLLKILYARTEIALAKNNLERLLAVSQFPEDVDFFAVLTSPVLEFGHDL